MLRRVILHIEFPKKEFNRIPLVLADDFSLRYRVEDNLFHLGIVTSSYWQNHIKVVMTLKIRKDETPVWYLRSIIENARQEEIVVMRNSKVMCRGGRLTRTESLDNVLDTHMVESLEAWITPETVTH